MELTQAIDILKRNAAAKQAETDAINLAVSVLEGTFAPELEVLELARVQINQKDSALSEKDSLIRTMEAEKAALQSEISRLTEELPDLTQEPM